MEGFEDPFNRQTYPWGCEDTELLDWYRALGRLRQQHPALRREAERIFSQACPNAEITLLFGGQPVYYYMISAE